MSTSLGLRFRERTATRVALVDVTVVPMDGNRLLQKQTVVIEDGYIRTVGPSARVPTAQMRLINCAGKYLMPGLADMHVHWWEPTDAALYLAHGVTTVRNMRGAPIHLKMKQLVAEAQAPGPHVVTASPLIDGLDSNKQTTRPDSLALTDPSEASAVVKQLASRGYEQIKAYQRLQPEVLRGLGAASADAGLRLTGHCPEGMSYEDAIAAGMSCFEHLTGITTGHLLSPADMSSDLAVPRIPYLKSASLLAHHVDFEQIRRVADDMATRQVWNCPTVVVNSAPLRDSQPQVDPLLRYTPLQLARRWTSLLRQRLGARDDVIPPEHRKLVHAKIDAALTIVGLLHEAGAPLVVGTDARNPFVYPGAAIHRELAHFIEAGLAPYEALRCATSEAARFVGEAETWGTVAEGKRADLILLGRDPLRGLCAVQEPEAVFVNGYCLSRSDLDDLLAQREAWARGVETLSPAALPGSSARDSKSLVQGILRETRYETPCTRIAYRHQRVADGTLVIEETYMASPAGTQGRTTLRLSPDLVIQDGRYLLRGVAGDEWCEVKRRADRRYEIRLTETDGRTSDTVLDAEALYPSERLSPSFFPVVLGDETLTRWLDGATLPALSVDNGRPQTINIALTRRHHAGERGGDPSWELTVHRYGEPTLQTYRFRATTGFIDMIETGGLTAMRLRPEPWLDDC